MSVVISKREKIIKVLKYLLFESILLILVFQLAYIITQNIVYLNISGVFTLGYLGAQEYRHHYFRDLLKALNSE